MACSQIVQEREEIEHGWQDTTCRFTLDKLLREHGYHIWRRPAGKESLWAKADIIFRQAEALLRLDRMEVGKARQLQEGYYDRCIDNGTQGRK